MKNVIILLALIFAPTASFGGDVSYGRYIPEPQKVNQTRLTYLFWDVYDIALYAPNGTYKNDAPFALEITYLLDLEGKDIAKVAKKEMKKLGQKNKDTLAKWHNQMAEIFPNVEKGERLVGIKGADGYAYFYNDGTFIGSVQDPEFTQYFFDIWLSPNTSRPDLRRELLKSDA